MNSNLSIIVKETSMKLLELASIYLPMDVEQALRKALENETEKVARTQLSNILVNVEMARERHLPLCQDTGIPMFRVKIGEDFPVKADLTSILFEAVREATISIPLRPNAIHPISRKNSGDNTGSYVPYIDWELVHGSALNLVVIPKGFGGENCSRLGMLLPGQGIRGLKRFVLETVVNAGGKPCPPTIIGVGVGLGVDGVTRLARKAALRPLMLRNEDQKIETLENELFELVNETGIGPMGLGGNTTALTVKIETGHTHTAALPVAVILHCWAARSAEATIYSDGFVEYKSHKM